MKAYFLSDVHLSSAEDKKAQVLLGFFRQLQSLSDVTHLFLLGDVFDLWVGEHEYFKKKFAPIIAELVRLKELGVEVHYFEGNHDLYLEKYFGRELGFHVHGAMESFEILGQKLRLEHGDEMNPEDYGYRFLRWWLRTPVMRALAPRLPEFVVIWLGEKMSEASRKYTSQYKTVSSEAAQGIIRAHAHRAWKKNYFDVIISGHVHALEDYEFLVTLPTGENKKIRVMNLGSWFDGYRVLEMTEKRLAFVELKG